MVRLVVGAPEPVGGTICPIIPSVGLTTLPTALAAPVVTLLTVDWTVDCAPPTVCDNPCVPGMIGSPAPPALPPGEADPPPPPVVPLRLPVMLLWVPVAPPLVPAPPVVLAALDGLVEVAAGDAAVAFNGDADEPGDAEGESESARGPDASVVLSRLEMAEGGVEAVDPEAVKA